MWDKGYLPCVCFYSEAAWAPERFAAPYEEFVVASDDGSSICRIMPLRLIEDHRAVLAALWSAVPHMLLERQAQHSGLIIKDPITKPARGTLYIIA
mgnify:CR=1 FL=1|jgi:hypothetical protein